MGLAKRYGVRLEHLFVAVVFLAFAWALSSYKINNVAWLRGDSAVVFQLTDNIAHTGVPVSSVFATNTAFVVKSGLLHKPTEEVMRSLTPLPNEPANPLAGHAYYILYPIALIARVFPADEVLLSLFALSFAGVVLVAYLGLRAAGLPIAAASLFCLLIVSHPFWWNNILYGQVFPDSFFVLAGLLFMHYSARDDTPKIALIALAMLCASINERGALMAGIFLLAYVILYWKQTARLRTFKLLLGLGLLAYSVVLLKLVLVNAFYSSFLLSPENLIASFQSGTYAQMSELFLLINAPFLLLALFEYRAAAIAALLMLPNLLGTLGGAEKGGWSTHYHAFYFPALVWAAMLGYATLWRKASAPSAERRAAMAAAYALIVALLVFMNLIVPVDYTHVSVSPANIPNTALGKLFKDVPQFVGPSGRGYGPAVDLVQQTVPEHSLVSTVEAGMPMLYRDRTLQFFPLDVDRADYVVMTAWQPPGSTSVAFNGALNYLGPEEQKKLNTAVVARMKNDCYDFAHAVLVPVFALGIVKRDHDCARGKARP